MHEKYDSGDMMSLVMQSYLGSTLKDELVIDIAPIQYELVEVYWKKKYGRKDQANVKEQTFGSEISARQSTIQMHQKIQQSNIKYASNKSPI